MVLIRVEGIHPDAEGFRCYPLYSETFFTEHSSDEAFFQFRGVQFIEGRGKVISLLHIHHIWYLIRQVYIILLDYTVSTLCNSMIYILYWSDIKIYPHSTSTVAICKPDYCCVSQNYINVSGVQNYVL